MSKTGAEGGNGMQDGLRKPYINNLIMKNVHIRCPSSKSLVEGFFK